MDIWTEWCAVRPSGEWRGHGQVWCSWSLGGWKQQVGCIARLFWSSISGAHLLTWYHLLTICFNRLKSVRLLPILFYLFLYYLCGVLLWILSELKWWKQCMVLEFTVSKTRFKIIVSWQEQIMVQTLQKNSSHISRHPESQLQIFKEIASVLHVCCTVNIGTWQDGVNSSSARTRVYSFSSCPSRMSEPVNQTSMIFQGLALSSHTFIIAHTHRSSHEFLGSPSVPWFLDF